VNVFAESDGSQRLPTITTLDLSVAKDFSLGPGVLGFGVDVFNVFNANTTTNAQNLSGPNYMAPTSILAPRVARLGIWYQF
jgi:hypothetical protein